LLDFSIEKRGDILKTQTNSKIKKCEIQISNKFNLKMGCTSSKHLQYASASSLEGTHSGSDKTLKYLVSPKSSQKLKNPSQYETKDHIRIICLIKYAAEPSIRNLVKNYKILNFSASIGLSSYLKSKKVLLRPKQVIGNIKLSIGETVTKYTREIHRHTYRSVKNWSY